jgi:hypothetical protein
MAQNSLFKKLCNYKILKIGWYLAHNDTRNNFVLDPIGYADFAFQLSDRLNFIIEEIENDRYCPRHLTEIDIPKSGLSVRPGSILPIEDMVVLHACIFLLAPKLDGKLKENVYSYRLRKDWEKKVKNKESLFKEGDPEFPFLKRKTIGDFNPFEKWYERWFAFEKASNKACTVEGYTHLTKTDITAYFENIDLSALEALLRSFLGKEEQIIHLVFKILRSWTRSTSTGTPIGRGIPQGNEVSSFLGNIYLMRLDDRLDEFCKKNDAKWFRYVDDVKVYTRSKHLARKIVFEVNNALRSLYLNIQASKTEIIFDKKLEIELDRAGLDKVNEVNKSISKIKNPTPQVITKELDKLNKIILPFRRKDKISDFTNLDEKEHQLLRRLMTVYGSQGRTHFKKTAIKTIKQLPDIKLLNSSLNYLVKLPNQYHDEILGFFLETIEEGDLPIPYQIALVLQYIARIHPGIDESKKVGSIIRKSILNKHREWVVIQKALEAIMVYPYRSNYIKSLVEKYLTYSHHMVRRAALQLLVRCPHDYAKQKIERGVYYANPNISGMALYLFRLYDDTDYAYNQLKSIKKGQQNDIAFQRNLHKLYAMAMTKDEKFLEKLARYIISSEKIIKSKRLRWHCNKIIN